MASRVAETLQVDILEVNECMKRDSDRINNFLQLDAPKDSEERPAIFFYSVREKPAKPGQDAAKGDVSPKHVYCCDKEGCAGEDGVSVEEKCIYFLRTKDKAVNLKNTSDETILVGEVSSDILRQFETTLSKVCRSSCSHLDLHLTRIVLFLQLYFPMLNNSSSWGQIKDEVDQSSFMQTAHKFSTGLKRIITNMGGDLQLEEVNEPYNTIEPTQKAYELAAESPDTVNYCRGTPGRSCRERIFHTISLIYEQIFLTLGALL